MSGSYFAGLPGLEPGKAGPESAVLPLHHSPMLNCDAKVQHFLVIQIFFELFLSQNAKKVSKAGRAAQNRGLLFSIRENIKYLCKEREYP